MEAELVAWIILIVATAIGVVAVYSDYSDNPLLFFIASMLIFKILKCEKKAKKPRNLYMK